MPEAKPISRGAPLGLILLLLAVLSPAASAAAAQAPPFDWTMPARLGGDGDGDGLLDYAGSAAEFEEEEEARAGFPIELEVRSDLCRKGADYVWRSPAGVGGGRGTAGCQVRQAFPTEGEHPVQLEVRFAGGRTLGFERTVTVQDWLVVSIGDSVASGEGNPDHRGGLFRRARWKSPRCHRSAKAGPALAAFELEAADPRTSATLVHLACSGAEIGTGLLRGYRGIDAGPNVEPRLLPPQVAELERIDAARGVDAVLLSIGANDVHFGPIVAFCLVERRCRQKQFVPEEERPPAPRPLEDVVEDALGQLPESYARLAGRLGHVVPSERVLIVEYFDSTRDERGETCKRIGLANPLRSLQIDQDEARWAAAHVLEPLNAIVAEAADDAEWTLVGGVAEAFRTHGYCARESWIRHIGESLREQKGETRKSRLTGALHPNGEGHRQEGEMIGLALAANLYGGPLAGAASDSVVVTVDGGGGPDQSDGEGDLEEAAAIGLGAAAALAGLAALAIGQRRPGDEEAWEAEPEVPGPPDAWPAEEEVAAFADLVADPARWVHRRVESIEIVDERLVRRRVSVDFTPETSPGAPPPTRAPIALLSKRVLSNFDLRDENGASVPLATSEQNAAFAAAHMLSIAAEAIGGEPSERLRRLCWRIARGNPPEAREAVHEIATGLEPAADREALRRSDRFRSATETFAANFAVLVEVGEPRRRVVKFAYDQVLAGGLSWRQRLGLAPVLTAIDIPELGDAASRHFEFARAEGLEILGAQLLAVKPDGETVPQEGASDGAEAHLAVVRRPRGTRGLAGVLLRAARSGILVGGPPLAALSALALTIAWFALPGLAGDSAGGTASILLAVPAAFGAYLGSRASHPLEAAMLLGARVLVFLSGVLAFLGAGALALDASAELLRVVLGVAAVLSWLIALALLTTLLLPRPSARNPRKRVL